MEVVGHQIQGVTVGQQPGQTLRDLFAVRLCDANVHLRRTGGFGFHLRFH
jgi:hypothetical protein